MQISTFNAYTGDTGTIKFINFIMCIFLFSAKIFTLIFYFNSKDFESVFSGLQGGTRQSISFLCFLDTNIISSSFVLHSCSFLLSSTETAEDRKHCEKCFSEWLKEYQIHEEIDWVIDYCQQHRKFYPRFKFNENLSTHQWHLNYYHTRESENYEETTHS